MNQPFLQNTCGSVAIALAMVLPGAVIAQEEAPEVPEELLEARAAFLDEVLDESRLLTEQFVRALGRTEGEAAARGDYGKAMSIQQRRDELTALFEGTDASLLGDDSISLEADEADLAGGVEVRLGQLTGWRSAASQAEWGDVSLPAGEYDLVFEAAMVPAPAIGGGFGPGPPADRPRPARTAAFEFFEVSLLAGAAENRRGFELRPTADGVTFTSYRIGPISYTRSPVTLRLQPMDAYPLNIIRFRDVSLVPAVDEESSAGVAVAGSADEGLEAHRAALEKALREIYDQAAADYLVELRAWGADKKGRRSVVQDEVAQVKRQNVDLDKSDSLLPPVVGLLGGFGAFRDVPEAMLVPGSVEAGDVFKMRTAEGEMSVRLFGVRCMPVDKEPGDAGQFFAKQFGIPAADAASLAPVAQEFTSGYLEGRIVRLLVRSAKSASSENPPLALVFLPDIGLFQNVLVDQGLAAVKADEAKAMKGPMPKAVIDGLQARATAARTRSDPPGAWALRAESTGGGR
jgi:hypothetical protein